MSKKGSFSKSGQITIFIILGILLLFGFIFIMYLTGSVKQEQLKTEQTKFTSNLFQKEAMRIYVQDCLEDELENGLILLGKQGRIWDDQPGGVKHFEENITGARYDGERVLFGITKEEYPSFQNAYPCNNDTNSTEFCRYKHPDFKAGFGNLELKESTLEEDLQRYLTNRTLWCVENFTKSNISQNAELVTKKLDLTVDIISEGINVKVYFPLKLKIGTEEFSQLTQFDFFYPSQFDGLLKAAVGDPLYRDWKMLEFSYTQDNLESFSVNYNSLAIEMEKKETPNGDNLFKFIPLMYSIINRPIEYSFHIARQNRPPALDYVERNGCPKYGYDYLVIAGENDSNGEINITMNAIDADEDKVNYSFMVPDKWINEILAFPGFSGPNIPQPGNIVISYIPLYNQTLYVNRTKIGEYFVPFIYNLTANSTDEHNLSDWQVVRVLVDRPLTVEVTASSPYTDVSDGVFLGGTAYISAEDPTFLTVTLPENTIIPEATPQTTLNYTSFDGTINWGYKIQDGPSNELNVIPTTSDGCYVFPYDGIKSCAGVPYGSDQDIKTKLPYEKFGKIGTSGKLNLSYSMDYCSQLNASRYVEINTFVVPCIPHKNPERPFAYNSGGQYHKYKFGLIDGKTDFTKLLESPSTQNNINPLEATHSCCIGVPENPSSWKLVEKNDPQNPCFVNPKPACSGGISEYKVANGGKDYSGYILEEEMQLCSGNRGNVCDGGKSSRLWKNELKCGGVGYDKCKPTIPKECQGALAWTYVDSNSDKINDEWCHGMFGCSDLCKSEVVSLKEYHDLDLNGVNKQAKDGFFIKDEEIGLVCGCTGTTEGKTCDSNFDGSFIGTCKNGKCNGDN